MLKEAIAAALTLLPSSWTSHVDFDRELRDLLADRAGEPALLRAELRARGPAAAVRILAAMDEHEVPGVALLRGARSALHGLGYDVLHASALALDRDLVIAALSERVRQESHPGAPRTALRLLAEIGRARDLGLAVRAATSRGAAADSHVPVALERATRLLLERDRAALAEVESRLLQGPAEVAGPLVRATDALDPADALDWCARLVNRRSELGALLLAQMARIGEAHPDAVADSVRDAARPFLGAADPALVKQAALTAGKLEDHDALEPLIALLDHEDPGVRASAHWALKQVTGMRFPEESRRWTAWYRAEARWFEDEAPELFAELDAPDPRILHALNELARRRYQRPTLAGEVERVLDHDNARIRKMGCSVLRGIGGSAELPALVRRLDDENPDVVREAWQALKSLTGHDTPADAAAWREVLAARGGSR